jgi:ring-1,2-phenylacetyl-CoA epoxidase subunit PaaC
MTTSTRYVLQLADNALVLGHRQSEWCGHGPVLEQDIAITNLSLDLIGQARSLYQYAAEQAGDGATEDSLAYLRDTREFRNFLLLELPNGDWGRTVLRTFFFSQYQQLSYAAMEKCRDLQLAAIAAKAVKEVDYHLRWSREWVIRLGDGTEESHERMLRALDGIWGYTGEFFLPDDVELDMIRQGVAPDTAALHPHWLDAVKATLDEASLAFPGETYMHSGGREGRHTEHLGYILADMQFLQRAYPGCAW